jgi:sugar lactone lactonase YvrE
MKVMGLGTYFNQATFLASMNETTYYSVVNPVAQEQIFLSSPYINSIAGTGTPGTSFSGQVAQFARLGTQLSKAATDSSGTTYIGTKDLGWKIQKIDSAGKISTVAGNYRYFYGDGGDPVAAAFGPRLAVSVSPQSQVVITDISNVRIRILAPGNIVETIAGTGGSSYSGDGGLAYLATFSTPTATATDTSGNIFVADTYNQVIRKITGSTITTFGGTAGLVGNTGDGGAALAATLTTPFGIAADSSNNIYFTDLSACAIRRISPQGAITLIAGTYAPGFGGDGGPAIAATLSTPRGIALDTNNNIYFCDTGNSRIRRIDANTGIIETVAGNGVEAYGGDNGLAVNARLSTPTGVATDGTGNVYLADTNNQCIRFVDMTTYKITTVAGIPTQQGYSGDYSFPKFARLNSPSHMAFDLTTGYYYFADDGNARIRYVDPSINIINTVAGNGSPLYKGDGGNASGAIFGGIKSLTCDSANRLYIVDDIAHVIRVIDLASGIISNVAGTGVAGFSGDGGPALLANLSSPQDVVVDSNANLYFTDRDSQRVRQITATGQVSSFAGTGVAGYNGDSISSIYATLNNPTALAIDPANGTLYIGDLNNNRIRAVTESRIIGTYAGGGNYGAPTQGASFASTLLASTTSIAVDANSQVYFTEVVTNGLWKLNRATNAVEAMNVTSAGAYLGDSGPLSNAYLSTPVGLTADSMGNFVIADQGSSHLRRTYTFGYPQTPVYLTMNFAYTNYFASTGTTSIALNGNPLVTFYGSNFSNGSYALSNANVFDYPLQYVNPVYQDTTPFVEITQTDSYGYTKLDGSLFVQEVPSQGLLENSVNSNTGIIMNSGVIQFPYQADGITIDNRFNDVSTRNVLYTGQLLTASDPLLKEEIEPADLALCCSTMLRIPLKRYKYTGAYSSTFRVKDIHRLGFLTTDVAPAFPNSVTALRNEEHAWISSRSGLDTAQLKYNHYGVTQHLMGLVSTLEWEVEHVARSIVAQRNTIL